MKQGQTFFEYVSKISEIEIGEKTKEAIVIIQTEILKKLSYKKVEFQIGHHSFKYSHFVLEEVQNYFKKLGFKVEYGVVFNSCLEPRKSFIVKW